MNLPARGKLERPPDQQQQIDVVVDDQGAKSGAVLAQGFAMVDISRVLSYGRSA